jgi:hypothetical protein
MNLFHPGYGIYSWGPLLLMGLVPAIWYRANTLILPRRERRFVAACFLAILLFSSANQYARLQWNSGFRYLVPLVPFICLALADHWVRLPRWSRLSIWIFVGLHSWVLTVFRENSLLLSWSDFFHEGIQLPWFRVLRMTSAPDSWLLKGQVVPIAILSVTFLVCCTIWRVGARRENQQVAARIAPSRVVV